MASRTSEASSSTAIASAVTATAPSSVDDGRVRDSAARMGTAKTMPMIAIGWTSAIGPLPSASTWKVKPIGPNASAKSHSGRCRRNLISPSTPSPSGARPVARCWVEVDTAVVAALARPNTTASQITLRR
ncbi:hypothetical protein ASE01_11335 [Nocardioides sp. Root190]|nr:hypothetical protein ASE01_11335 [Nocardioides sp. Root190]